MNYQLIIKKSLALFMTIMLAPGILLTMAGSAMAQENRVASGGNIPAAPSKAPGPTDAAELEAFLDQLIGKQMEENHIAGAAISVVKDGELFLAKGYGYADLADGVPVDPEQTVFRIGSVGKVFTWTAVMQLVEQGKLDLEADINAYLDFRIPDTYPQPITLRHLLTHTSGFEDRQFGSVVPDARDELPVRAFLISHMSARVRPPGDAGYANYNAMLAGYIVARVSGQPYEDYLQEHILDPLGMAHSTARTSLPPDLRPLASVGYTYAEGAFQAFPEYLAQPAGLPSGFHRASVTDMARFMIAHLQDGRYRDANTAEARILKEGTMEQMHSTLYTPDPRLRGTAYGLFDFSDNGQRTLGHSGYSPPMHSLLLLLPDQHLGVFVVYNSSGGGELTNQHSGFQRAFFDHYYPASAVAPLPPPADFAERAGRFVGSYNTLSANTTLIKIMGLFNGGYTSTISASGHGTLLFTLEGLTFEFVEVEPLYFRQVDGPRTAGPFALVFREDGRGRITHLFTDLLPQYASVKLDWYETSSFNRVLLLVCLLVFLSMIPAAAIRLIRNRRSGANTAHGILLGISMLNLLFVAGIVWGAMGGTTNELLEPVLIIKIALGLGVVSVMLTVVALVTSALAWVDRAWGFAGRLYYTLVTMAAVAFVWFMSYWNLLGWRY